jgi:hypothetical protein
VALRRQRQMCIRDSLHFDVTPVNLKFAEVAVISQHRLES